VRGELPDEEEKEKYSVDFLLKGTLGDEAEEIERERLGDFKHYERENFGTAEVPVVIDRGTSEAKPKSGVGWGLGKSTGLSLEQKQLIRYESPLSSLFSRIIHVALLSLQSTCLVVQNIHFERVIVLLCT